MKFLRHDGGQLLFQLRGNDRDVLGWLLGLYPVMPPDLVEITRTAALDPDGERRQVLMEALAEQRKENARRIQSFLQDDERFKRQGAQFLLRLKDPEADWLLEVLNEIRVGSWVRLGRPQKDAEGNLPIHRESLRYLWAMELSGYLESRLLDGLTAHP